MFLRIEQLQEKLLIGKHTTMSFANIKTVELGRNFMPSKKLIKNNVGSDIYSIEVFRPGFFENFSPENEFEKWIAIEVTDFNLVPEGMSTLKFPAGICAVFLHQGAASEAKATYDYIFRTWLPQSGYQVDYRPHFAIMGDKYQPLSSANEEEIWIPIRIN